MLRNLLKISFEILNRLNIGTHAHARHIDVQNTCFSSNLVLNLVKIPDTRRANLYKTLPCLKNKFVLVVKWDNQTQFYILFLLCQISPILPVEKNKTQRMILMLPIYRKLFMLKHL